MDVSAGVRGEEKFEATLEREGDGVGGFVPRDDDFFPTVGGFENDGDVFPGCLVDLGVGSHGEEGPGVTPGGAPVAARGALSEETSEGGFAGGRVGLEGGPGEELDGFGVSVGHPVAGVGACFLRKFEEFCGILLSGRVHREGEESAGGFGEVIDFFSELEVVGWFGLVKAGEDVEGPGVVFVVVVGLDAGNSAEF